MKFASSILLLASVGAAIGSTIPTRHIKRDVVCPGTDDNGGKLINSGPAGSGFLQCRYSEAGSCTYFDSDGSFSSGSSVCPDSASGSAPSPQPSGLQCPTEDLIDEEFEGGFINCEFETAGFCSYFTNGDISSGGSQCPKGLVAGGAANDAPAATTATPVTTTAAAPAPTGTAATSLFGKCPATSKNNVPLKEQRQVGGFTACEYEKQLCTYFSANGNFSSGSSECPSSLERSAAPAIKGAASVASLSCPLKSKSNVALDESRPIGSFTACEYDGRLCTYFTNGDFSSGSSDCPPGLVPSNDGNKPATGVAALQCPAAAKDETPLSGSGAKDSNTVCKYGTQTCVYFAGNGDFSSGSSNCPSGLATGTKARLSGAVENNSSSTSSSDDYSALLRNSFIAIGLLGAVLLGLIVLIIVILGKGGLKGKGRSVIPPGPSYSAVDVSQMKYADRG